MPNINENHKDKLFPIVAIGASAGGLEAISSLLEHLPPKLGMAYVIIQHLSPVYPSILPELLERKTTMPVLQVTDGLAVERDKVYVIPPNSYMSIVDHKLILSPRVQTDGFYHSIDHFLMALAPVYKHNAIAVILSGTATDGTDGIRVIKAEGGITFAQDESAKFRGMPDSAANSGNVDFIMAPDQMAAELETLSRLPYTALASLDDVSLREQELRKIQVLLFKKWRVDFSNYKQSTITRRILRRMALNKIKQLEDYTRFLREDQTEINLLYKDLLINVTSFFREPLLFEEFSRSIFPTLFGNKKPADIIRIWVPACSSGEEVYSIAICLFEWLAQQSVVSPIQLFATDLSEGAIEKARMGIYSIASVEKISPERLEQFFIKIDGHYQIIKPIRDVCIFATHDLLKDPPFSKLDLISCQNVLIYLESESQKRILQSFHYALKPSGYLLLGRSETIGGSGELFNSASKEFKLFTKKTHSNFPFDFSVRNNVNAPFNATDEEKMVTSQPAEPDIDKEAEKVLLSRYVPASVTVDQDLHIKQFYGSTINYLHPAAGKASFHLLKMVREELIFEVRLLLNKAMKDAIPAKKDGILLSDDKYKREISIEVVPLRTSSNRSHYLIVFKETGSEPSEAPSQEPGQLETNREDDSRVVHIKTLEQEIKAARDQIKMITEDSEAHREELQSANEEILSSNEELKSINEELETSKEELQSSNEELTTINEELLIRNIDLKEAVEYSEAIIQTITEPLVVLNADMRIRTANKAFYKSFQLRPADTEGNYFYETANGQWNIPELRKELDSIVHKDKSFENFELSHDFPAIGQRTLLFNAMRMSIDNNKGRRFLLAIQDITDRVTNLRELSYTKEYFRLLVQNAFDVITIFSPNGDIKYQSESMKRVLGYSPEESIGTNIFTDGIAHPDDLAIKREWFATCKATPNEPISQEFRLRHKDGTYKYIDAVCINLLDNPFINGIVGNYRDITNQKSLERQREEFIGIASHELRTPVTSIKGYTQLIQATLSGSGATQAGEFTEKLHKQVDRLMHLIEKLLDVTRISGGQLQLQLSTFDINDLLKERADELSQTTSANIIMELQECPVIRADRERIGQVITNLLSNAVKYSPPNEKIIIRTSFQSGVGAELYKVTVSIRDFGGGISETMQSAIFDRFFRVKDANTNIIPGLGLGL